MKRGDGVTLVFDCVGEALLLLWGLMLRAVGIGIIGVTVLRGGSVWDGIFDEMADGFGDRDVREEGIGMPENAPGRAICEVGFTGHILGADMKDSGERVHELMDPLENFIGRRISVAVIEPSFDDAHVVSESDES